MLHRRIARIVTAPPLEPGFIGPGHLASHLIGPDDFALADPFIALADDHIDIGERPVGGAHPHAGFETVTLVLDGAIHDRDEGGVIGAGGVQWMTAGAGIIHGEDIRAQGRVRILQLWLTLPKRERWTTPGFQIIRADAVPVRREPGVTARVYSGASGPVRSSTRNHVPVTLIEIALDAGATVDQSLPASYNGFILMVRGSVRVGEDAAPLSANQIGWLDRPDGDGESVMRIRGGDEGARLVIYAGQPQGDAIVSHGPFIADARDDIARLVNEYRAGKFVRLSTLTRAAHTS